MSTSDEVKPAVLPPPLPNASPPWPRWPPWYGPAALLTGLFGYSVLLVLVEGLLRAVGINPKSPGATDVLTIGQDVVFVATAVGFASMTARPRPWHFGLRGRPLLATARTALIGFVAYWVVWVAYNLAVNPHGKQSVTKDLGADKSTAALIGGAIVVLVVVPVAEELFFRGFFYRALRTRFGIWSAAAIDAVVFGAVHYTGTSTLTVLPELAVLGFVFCLVYERTGTIYATIALHAVNNAVAYGAGTRHGAVISAVLGVAMVAAAAGAIMRTPAGAHRSRAPA